MTGKLPSESGELRRPSASWGQVLQSNIVSQFKT